MYNTVDLKRLRLHVRGGGEFRGLWGRFLGRPAQRVGVNHMYTAYESYDMILACGVTDPVWCRAHEYADGSGPWHTHGEGRYTGGRGGGAECPYAWPCHPTLCCEPGEGQKGAPSILLRVDGSECVNTLPHLIKGAGIVGVLCLRAEVRENRDRLRSRAAPRPCRIPQSTPRQHRGLPSSAPRTGTCWACMLRTSAGSYSYRSGISSPEHRM